MKKTWSRMAGFVILVICVYLVVFHPRYVTYEGEDPDWFVQVNAKLVGLNGSYAIKIHYKGNEPVNIVETNIHPHYSSGMVVLDRDGSYYWECEQDCGYYDQEEELLFFIVWQKDGSLEEQMKLLRLEKVDK